MKLSGKTAIVTGAGGGIGRAIALRLAREGADVAVADIREEHAATTKDEVKALVRRSIALGVDVTDRGQVRDMVDKVAREFGKIDILVNNAGGSTLYPKPGETLDPRLAPAPTEVLDEEYWDRIIDLNLKSTFLCSQAVLPIMKKQGWGRIVNLASIMGRTSKSPVSGIAYSSAKGGIVAFTRHLGSEVASQGITVNAIAPGMVVTERLERLYLTDEAWKQQTLRDIPMGRGAKPDEMASVVAFLVSDDASYMTGVTLDVNGGWFTS